MIHGVTSVSAICLWTSMFFKWSEKLHCVDFVALFQAESGTPRFLLVGSFTSTGIWDFSKFVARFQLKWAEVKGRKKEQLRSLEFQTQDIALKSRIGSILSILSRVFSFHMRNSQIYLHSEGDFNIIPLTQGGGTEENSVTPHRLKESESQK